MHGVVRPQRGQIERIKTGDDKLPIELEAFYLMDKALGWGSHKEDERQSWIMHSENDRVTMVDGASAQAASAR